MAVERLPCRSDGCTNTILPATAKANDGYCMVCVGKRREAERAEFIRQNRRTIDLYEGIADPVEIIRILHTPRELDPLKQFAPPPKSVEELYASLDSMQADRLMRMAANALRSDGKRLAEEIGKSLATLTDFSLDSMLDTWLARNHHRPSVVFRWAGPDIRDRLLDVMDGISGTLNIDHALCALAWIGDQQVCERFLQWEQSPPMWRKELHVGPSSYAHVAGWEPTPRNSAGQIHESGIRLG
jgi:hypothetical protein